MTDATLLLASASPRRAAILESLGVAFEVRATATDETPLVDEAATDMVLRLAVAKAQAAKDEPVLAADTAVVLDDRIFGKPASKDQALAMLERLSGRTHQVVTGVAVIADGITRTASSLTDVTFRDVARDEAIRYWESGEPRGKAGAYAIQGLGGVFVAAVRGSYSGVVGLPVFETAALLRQAGIEIIPGTG